MNMTLNTAKSAQPSAGGPARRAYVPALNFTDLNTLLLIDRPSQSRKKHTFQLQLTRLIARRLPD